MKKQLRAKYSTLYFLLAVSLLLAAVPVTTFAQAEPQIPAVKAAGKENHIQRKHQKIA